MMKVKGRIVKVTALKAELRAQMFNIMNEYYAGVTFESFEKDLNEKNHVILMETREGVVGFSTLKWTEITLQGRKVIGVFSGDTILKQEYWGTPALGIRFLEYLWTLKLKNPMKPVYWFLISKGYKTYLLMANNFRDSYPRPERATPAFEQALRDHFYSEKFGDQYNPLTGVITFQTEDKCRLKQFVAPINNEMREKYPRLRFFEEVNPGWEQGLELACITRLTVDLQNLVIMPTVYLFKKVICGKFMKLARNRPKTRAPLSATAVSSSGVHGSIVLPRGHRTVVDQRKGARLGS